MYSRGRRGAPAKGVGRVNRRESSNLSISANKTTPQQGGFFIGEPRRIEHERPREGTSLPLAVRGGGRRVSEQIYSCEVRRREAARQNLSISAKEKALLWQCFFFWRRKRFEHECPRVSEQIYICEVRRRVAAGRDLSVSSPHSSFLPLFRPYLPPIRPRCPCLCTHIVPTSYNIM